eukprot:TRINITY_DN9484_c0_g2_i1.p1 TRINITY_DN9484_c0_g2~~TRINITY_DN9484_c0_g2_i1.p1  ORF type:complete len:536 (+),score=113.23 TRINITY_DN9484_c0_g2_i1:31-1638(+)
MADEPRVTINDLPEEILELILAAVSFQERCSSYARVCKSWRSVVYGSATGVVDLSLAPSQMNLAKLHGVRACFVNLTAIKLPSSTSLSCSELKEFTQETPNLKQLQMIGVPLVFDDNQSTFEQALAPIASTLEVLEFSYVPHLNSLSDSLGNEGNMFDGWTIAFPVLHTLTVTQCRVSTQTLAYVGTNCPKLQKLNMTLGKTAEGDNLLELLRKLPLRKLAINLKGTVSVESVLRAFPDMTHLELHGQFQPTEKEAEVFTTKLRSLTSFSKVLPNVRAPYLRKLALKNAEISNLQELTNLLTECSNLEELSVRRMAVNTAIFDFVRLELPLLKVLNLQTVKLGSNPFERFEALDDASHHGLNHNIEELTLGQGRGDGMEDDCDGITLANGLKWFPNVKRLRLLAFEHFSPAVLKVIGTMTQLEMLDIMWCSSVTMDSLGECVHNLPNLKELRFFGINDLNNHFLKELTIWRPELECLECGDSGVDSEGLEILLDKANFPRLRHLWATFNSDCIQRMAAARPQVTMHLGRKLRWNV